MDKLPLTCSGRNKRPTITEEMRRDAAFALVKDFIKTGIVEADAAIAAADDIAKATRLEQHDGYKIARELERCGWDCDMEIAEALEGFSFILDDIYQAAERQWAADNPQEPIAGDGMEVMWRGQPATIHGTCDRRPQCYKMRQGKMDDGRYFIVPFEEIEL